MDAIANDLEHSLDIGYFATNGGTGPVYRSMTAMPAPANDPALAITVGMRSIGLGR